MAFFLASGRVAQAADNSIAVLGIEATDGAPEAVANALTDALRQRATAEKGMRLVPGKDLIEVKLIFSCPDEAPSCMAEAAKTLGASKLIFGSVKKAAGESYVVTLKLLDVGRRQVDAWVAEQINRVQASQAGMRAAVPKWFATLTGQGALGALRVHGDVPGTAVALDGAPVGVIGSQDLLLPNIVAGKHEVLASKPGYGPIRKDITVSAGGVVDVGFQMVSSNTPPPVGGYGATNGDSGLASSSSEEAARLSASGSPDDGNRAVFRVASWATAAAAAVGFGLAIKFAFDVNAINKDLDPYRLVTCADGSGLCNSKGEPTVRTPTEQNYVDLLQADGNRFEKLQYIALGAGAACAIASGVLFYFGYLSDDSGAVALGPRKQAVNLHFFPLIGVGSGGMAAHLRF